MQHLPLSSVLCLLYASCALAIQGDNFNDPIPLTLSETPQTIQNTSHTNDFQHLIGQPNYDYVSWCNPDGDAYYNELQLFTGSDTWYSFTLLSTSRVELEFFDWAMFIILDQHRQVICYKNCIDSDYDVILSAGEYFLILDTWYEEYGYFLMSSGSDQNLIWESAEISANPLDLSLFLPPHLVAIHGSTTSIPTDTYCEEALWASSNSSLDYHTKLSASVVGDYISIVAADGDGAEFERIHVYCQLEDHRRCLVSSPLVHILPNANSYFSLGPACERPIHDFAELSSQRILVGDVAASELYIHWYLQEGIGGPISSWCEDTVPAASFFHWIAPSRPFTSAELPSHEDLILWPEISDGSWTRNINGEECSICFYGLGIPAQTNAEGFALGEPYPNPFNPELSIPVTLPTQGELILRVYNLRGEQVATLANGTFASGEYLFLLDGQNLASGVYLLHLVTAGGSFCKKVVLAK